MVLNLLVGRMVLTGLLILSSVPVQAGAAGLTESQRAYLEENEPFTFCVDPDWPPYEVISATGTHEGIAADLLQLASNKVGVKLNLFPTKDWEETIAQSKSGTCQIVSFLNQTPDRDKWLIYTRPIFIDKNVIITREEHPYIDDLAAVSGKTLVLPKGTSIEERVRRDFPNLTILTTESEADAFAMVSQHKADMTLRSLIVSVYTIKKEGWFNLKIAGQVPGYENNLRIGIRKDLPILRDILDQGVAAILPSQRADIANQHVSIKVQSGIDYNLILKIVLLFSVVLLTSLAWAIKLRAVNKKLKYLAQTDPLTQLANRSSINERMKREIDRSRRYLRPFSVILIDIDYFKRINDEFGHLMGDKFLIDFSKIALRTVRSQDMVGRWGGEEFIVLCAETNADQAMILAERLCQAIREHLFETKRRHSISAGVATLDAQDGIDSLVNRADEALYEAKQNGRDQVRYGIKIEIAHHDFKEKSLSVL